MAEIKKINTEFQLLDKLLDTSGDAGTSGQVLSSTATGINWVSGSNLPGGPYLPLTGGTMTGNTNHIDGIIANFGNSNDLQIYHDGSNSYIKEIGTGNLRIRSTSLRLEGTDSSNMVVANQGGSVSLYYNASKKFETSNGGVSVTGDGIFTGNVGIGTTSPSAALEVVGGIKLSDNSPLTWATSNTRIFGQSGYMQFQVGSTDKMRITSSGNVGIGTTSPSEKLDVEGNVRVGVNNGFYINNQNVGIKRTSNDLVLGGFGNVIITSSSTTVVNQVERMRITSAGNVGIGTTSPTYILDVVSSGTATARLKSAGTGAISLRYENGGGFKSAAVVDNNGLYRLDATNISLNPTNNVGIGTTSPQTKLQVEYTDTHTSGDLALANSAFDIYNDSTTDVAGKGSTITFSDNYLGTNKTTRAAIKGGTDTAGNTADGFLAFYTDSSSANSMQQRMIINHDGRVSFNYYGSGSFTGTATQRLAVDTSGNVIEIPIGSGPVDGSGTANYSARWIDTDTLGIGTLYDNGTNVGIGTTSPTHNLHIASDAPVIRLQDNTSSDNHYLNGNNGEFRIQTTGFLTLRPGNTESVRFLANGNVGINETNPTKKLQVNGQTKFYEYSGAHLTNQATSNFNFDTLANNAASTSGGSVGAFIKLTATPPGATSTWSTFRARAYGENTKGNTDGMITFFSEYRNYTSTNAVTLNYHAGLYVNPLGVGGLATVTNNYGVYLNPGTSATNNYGVYQNGSSVKNFFQGNVGIGTTSPAHKLTINASNNTTALGIDFPSAHFDFSASSTSGYTSNFRINDVGMDIGHDSTARSLNLQTGNQDRLTILGTGNVGIGTTSPVNKQQNKYTGVAINSMTATAGTASTNWNRNAGLLIEESNSSNGLALGVSQTANDRKSWIQSGHPGSAANSLGILSLNPLGGNVGIGTTSPLSKLNVNGDIKIEGENQLYFGSSGSVPLWEIKASGSNLVINDTGSNVGNLIFEGRDFGVGITSPQEKLHVSGETHPSIKLSSSSDSNYNVILNCGFRNEALNLSVGGYKVFTTEGFNTPETTHLYSNNSKALSLASNQAATFTSTVTATNFINSSDERLKENIEKVCNNTLDVKWKTFEFKSDKGQKRYGVIAQELEKTNPEFVREDAEGFKSVAYIDLLIAKIAELEERIQTLENK